MVLVCTFPFQWVWHGNMSDEDAGDVVKWSGIPPGTMEHCKEVEVLLIFSNDFGSCVVLVYICENSVSMFVFPHRHTQKLCKGKHNPMSGWVVTSLKASLF